MREKWDNRTAFILASIGSAVGLGNVWRFPYVCYENGGGAFLIPYFIALFTAGIPLLILEFSIGNKFGKGAPGALSLAGRGKEWLGWFAVLVAFVIVCYYSVIVGWSLSYTQYSASLSWGQDTESFFFSDYLSISESPFRLGGVKLPILIALFITWIAIILSIWKGPQTVGKVVWVTVILPWILLLVFVIKGVTLPGAFAGLSYYFRPDFQALKNPGVWLAAYGQVFFSLSIGFGIMMAYSSYLPRNSRIVSNAFIIGIADAATAFFAGIAVFATLGYHASTEGVAIENLISSSIPLAFITFPTIINHFPVFPELFGVLFFLMLFFLGIDSAFSLVEAFSCAIMDKWRLKRVPVLLSLGIIGFGIGILFATRAGILWLDIVDYFMCNWGLITIVFFECILLGYFYNFKHLKTYITRTTNMPLGWWEIMIKVISPLILAILLGVEIVSRVKSSYGGYSRGAEFIGGYGLLIVLLILAVLLSRGKIRQSD